LSKELFEPANDEDNSGIKEANHLWLSVEAAKFKFTTVNLMGLLFSTTNPKIMSLFIIRIELHDAADADYQSLHKAMETFVFKRTITRWDEEYQLPAAMYSIIADESLDQIFENARVAALITKKQFTIMVTRDGESRFQGLKKL
jgi:hypothetical protein